MPHVKALFQPPPPAPRGASHPYVNAAQFRPRAAWASATQCPDALAAALLVAGVGLELAFCWSYGYSYAHADGNAGDTSGRRTFQLMVFCVLVFTSIASLCYLKLLQHGGGAVLELAAFACTAVMLLCSGVCFSLQLPKLALALLLASCGAACHVWCHRRGLPFAGHVLEAATRALLAPHPAIGWVSVGCAVAQAAWALVFTTAAVGLQVRVQATADDDDASVSTPAGVGAFLGLALVYFWGAQVIRTSTVCALAIARLATLALTRTRTISLFLFAFQLS